MYTQSMFWAKIRKNITVFHLKIIIFIAVKYCSILPGHVCVMLLHSKSHKKCHKNFENWFIIENLTPKNDFDLVFYMCKGGNPKILNLEF